MLDERARASAALAGTVDRLGRDRFLELWGVQESDGDPALLVAPDPDGRPYV